MTALIIASVVAVLAIIMLVFLIASFSLVDYTIGGADAAGVFVCLGIIYLLIYGVGWIAIWHFCHKADVVASKFGRGKVVAVTDNVHETGAGGVTYEFHTYDYELVNDEGVKFHMYRQSDRYEVGQRCRLISDWNEIKVAETTTETEG